MAAGDGLATRSRMRGDGRPERRLSVLYLFAGGKRKGDMHFFLNEAGDKVNVKLNMREIDTLRGKKKHNLLNFAIRDKIMNKESDGKFDVILASPPCGTFSRARHAQDNGPKPLRSARYPRGLPWLGGKALASVKNANTLVDFTAEILQAQLRTKGLIVLEHPEDLGRLLHQAAEGRSPASIWRWPAIKGLVEEEGVGWGALYQQGFGTLSGNPPGFCPTCRSWERC